MNYNIYAIYSAVRLVYFFHDIFFEMQIIVWEIQYLLYECVSHADYAQNKCYIISITCFD